MLFLDPISPPSLLARRRDRVRQVDEGATPIQRRPESRQLDRLQLHDRRRRQHQQRLVAPRAPELPNRDRVVAGERPVSPDERPLSAADDGVPDADLDEFDLPELAASFPPGPNDGACSPFRAPCSEPIDSKTRSSSKRSTTFAAVGDWKKVVGGRFSAV